MLSESISIFFQNIFFGFFLTLILISIINWRLEKRSTNIVKVISEKFQDNALVLTYHGYSLAAREETKGDAIAVFKQIIEKKPYNINAYNRLLWLLIVTDALESEVRYYAEKLKDIEPDNVYVLTFDIYAYIKRGEVDKADACFDEVINIKGNDSTLYYIYGYLLISIKRYVEAEAVLYHGLKYLKFKRKDHFYEQLLFIYSKLDNDEKFEKTLSALHDLRPKDPRVLKILISWYLDHKDLEMADHYLEKAFKINRNKVDFYYLLGTKYYIERAYEKAEIAFKTVLSLTEPDDPVTYDTLVYLIEVYFQSDYQYGAVSPEEAEEILNKVIKFNPTDHQAITNKGKLLYEQFERYDEAEDLLNQALVMEPDDPLVNFFLGHFYFVVRKSYEKSEFFNLKTYALDKKFTNALYNLACIRSIQGKIEEALKFLEEAKELGEDISDAWKDEDLINLQADPRFVELVGPKPVE